MDQLVFALSTSLVLLGKFADFLMREAAGRSEEPATVASGPAAGGAPLRFARGAIDGAHSYLRSIFPGGFFNRTRLWRVLLISALLVQGSFLFSSIIKPEIWSVGHAGFPWLNLTATVLLLIFTNFFFDLISISLILYLLDQIGKAVDLYRGPRILWLSSLSVALVATFYLIVVSTMNLSFSLILHLQGVAAGYDMLSLSQGFEMQRRIWENETFWRFLDPVAEGWHIGLNGVNLFIFCLTPMLPPALLILVLTVGALLDVADAATGEWISRYIRGVRWSRRPFFLKFATIIALASSALAALSEVVPK